MSYHENPATGERNGASKLYENDIPCIRRMLNEGASLKFIAMIYEVNYRTISDIKSGRTWKHV